MKAPLAPSLIALFLLVLFSTTSYAQLTLLSEDFNDCNFPTGWSVNVIGDGTPTYYSGLPNNPESDGSTIDGSCMLIIDDDATGNNTPGYVLQIMSEVFDGTVSPTLELNMDVHWRPYGGSSLSTKVFDGANFHEVRKWGNDDGTGEEFSEFESVSLDLSFFASPTMQLVIEYDDNNEWAWWAGVDNIEIIAKGSGTNVLLETFNDCSLPPGWFTQIEAGEAEWQFGFVDNGNASYNSMNGTCMAYFDDDGLGQNAPFSTALLVSPEFSGSDFANYTLSFDFIFRKYEQLESVVIWVFDGTNSQQVVTYLDDVGGPQFIEYEQMEVDLSPYRSQTMRVIFAYNDGNGWGWWTGIDNVKITAEGAINDLCVNAFDLTTGADCLSGNNLTAIFDGTQPACSENNIAGLWYRYQADFTGILQLESQSDFNDVITVYTGGCQALAEMDCTNRDEFGFTGETLYMSVTNGTEYMIRVSGQDQTFGLPRGALCIAAKQVPAYPETPANDDCSNAVTLIMEDDCIVGNNHNANFIGPEPSLNLKSKADIWYIFEATTSDEIEILSNADFADVITLYSGTCGALTEIAMNDYGQVLKISGLNIGESYYIQVSGYFATLEGNVCIQVREVTAPVADNDLCVNATNVLVGGGCVEGQNISAEMDGPNPSCEVYPSANIWYQFVAPSSGGIKLNTGADFVHTVSVYSGNCTDLEEFFCEHNPTRCDGYLELNGLTPGLTYFIQISSPLNPFGYMEGEVCIDILDINSTSDFEPLDLSIVVNCIEDGIGQIQLTATGGVGTYTFQGNTEQDTFQTGDEYIVVLSDENNCEVSRIGIFDCGEIPCILPATLSTLDISCYGENNGQAVVVVSEGVEPYTYTWSNGASTSIINNLGPGNYSLTVTDDTGCPAEFSFAISEPDVLLGNISSTGETNVDSNDGTTSVEPSGGTAPFSYNWNTGSTDQNLTNLSPGIYTVTITDANGCEIIESTVVSAFECSGLSVEIITEEITCNGADNGHVEVYPDGGTAPYIYNWNIGGTTNVLSNLAPGTYTVTITDANDCPWVENITFAEPAALMAEIVENIPVDCNGNETGIVAIQASGGTAPYTYSWPGGASGPSQGDLPAGAHIVTITDVNGCTTTITVDITEPQLLTAISNNPQNVSCHDAADGIASVFADGGTAPYTFQWDDPNSQTSAQAINLGSGTYNVTVTDFNGCTALESVIISEPPPLIISIDLVLDETNSNGNGTIQTTVIGGTAPYTYEWIHNGEVVSVSADAFNLEAGSYDLYVTDANGCLVVSETIVLDNIVGTNDPELEQMIELLPNPTSGQFQLNIELDHSSVVSIQITDIAGKQIYVSPEEEFIQKTFDIDLSTYPAAVYPVRIKVGDKTVLKQLVIQK